MLNHKVDDKVSVNVNDSYSYDVIIRKIEKVQDDGTDQLRKF